MKKWICLLLLPVLLLGCDKEQTMETVSDIYVEPDPVPAQQVVLELPDTAAMGVIQSEDMGTVYFCDQYTISLETLSGGDLDRTLQSVTGYTKDRLRLLETAQGEHKRYDCVWTAAGEEEAQVGRTAILDDGHYHYALTCMTGESDAQGLQETWNDLFRSFTLLAVHTAP